MTGSLPLAGLQFELHGPVVPGPSPPYALTFADAPVAAPGGSLGALVLRVSGETELLEAHGGGLPAGAAGAEALAVRLRRLGAGLRWGAPEVVPTGAALLGLARGWGRSSLEVVRADPGLLPELAVGRWLEQPIGARACGPLLGSAAPALAAARPDLLAIAARAAFWRGVRSAATAAEWRRLRSGYTALLYHRLAGELKPGQERLDVAPRAFDRQMRMLRLLGMQPLTVERLVECHAPGGPPFPRRGVVVTADDAFRDVVEPLRRHADVRPLLFVPTAAVGGPAGWLDGEEVASWKELADLAESGVALGAHGRTHAQLPELADALAEEELRGSRDDLARQLRIDAVAFAYPNGRHGAREQALAAAAGYRVAFTTQLGRNGPGSDPFRLRRVSVKAWDSRLSFAWKLLTGEQPPRRWESWLILRSAAAGRLARGCRSARDRAAAAWPRSAARRPRQAP